MSKDLFVTINIGGNPVSQYNFYPTWDCIAYTDVPELYPSNFKCIPVNSKLPDAIVAKQIKWSLAKNHQEYSNVLYADSAYNVDEINGSNIFDTFSFWHLIETKHNIALIKHPSSKTISDEIQLCKRHQRWNDGYDYWLQQMLFRDVDLITERDMYANGIMYFKPKEVLSIFKKVYDQIQHCQRDQVVFPLVHPNTENILGLNENLYNNSMFTYNTLHDVTY